MKSTISCQTTSVIEDEMEEKKKEKEKKMGPNGWNTMGTLSMHSENVIARMETLAGVVSSAAPCVLSSHNELLYYDACYSCAHCSKGYRLAKI